MRMTFVAVLCLGLCACDDDDGGSSADRLGVGAECAGDEDCLQSEDDAGISQTCLPFKGGYCGVDDCVRNTDCPEGSACVMHTDGNNYCFRLCVDKPECNLNRSADTEANCSSSVEYADGDKATLGKACVPPSS